MSLTGQCYCGAVHYAVDGPFAYALNCHCGQCRRRTGAAFKPFAGIARERLRITRGEADLAILGSAENNHTSCASCGTLLFSVVQDGARVHVTLGTITGDPGISPRAHIFAGSKAPWFEITDGLPQFEGFPTS